LQIVGVPGGGRLLDGLIQPGDPDRVFAGVGGVSLSETGPRLREAPAASRREARSLSLDGPAAVTIGERGGERIARAEVRILEPPLGPIGDPDAFAAELRVLLPGIRACYERRLRDTVALEGKLTLRLSIDTAGQVTEVGVESQTLRDDELAACIRGRARNWRFSTGPAQLSVPLIFQAAR
jgi:hypothetical protein